MEKGILIYRHSDGSIEKIDSEWQTSRNQILAEIGQSEYSDTLLVSKQQSRSLAGRVGMVEHNPRMVVLRYVGSLPPVKPLDSMG